MIRIIHISILSILFLMASTLQAQPSDAQVIKDIHNPGVLDIKLSSKPGKKVWNGTHLQYFWQRGAIVYRSANLKDYPDAKVEIGGFARYDIINGNFSYREFKVTWNTYLGIPTPSDDEILQMVRDRQKDVFRGSYNSIVSQITKLRIAEEHNTEWHTPNSFSIDIACSYKEAVSYTEVADMDLIYRVRFYRDEVSGPWKENVVASRKSYEEKGRTTYTAEEIRTMPSLASMEAEQAAQAAMDNMPQVEIPAFSSDGDVFMFVHNLLMTATADEFEAAMMKMLAPGYFVEGSTLLLNRNGADLINRARKFAFEGKSTYAEQYCSDPSVKHRQANMIQFYNKSKRVFSRIAVGQFGGRYERGVKVDTEYKITGLDIGILTKQDDIDYMNSFPDEELCATVVEEAPAPPPIRWVNIIAQGSGIRIAFPQKVQEQVTDTQQGGKQYVMQAQHASGFYQMTALSLPQKYGDEQKMQIVNAMAQNFITSNQANTESEDSYELKSNPGKTYSLTKGENQIIKYRIFATDKMLFQLVFSSNTSSYQPQNEQKFFDSFRLLY